MKKPRAKKGMHVAMSTGGRHWQVPRMTEEMKRKISKARSKNITNSRAVLKLTDDDTVVERYSSIKEAAEANGAHYSTIRKVALQLWGYRTFKGYRYAFEDGRVATKRQNRKTKSSAKKRFQRVQKRKTA